MIAYDDFRLLGRSGHGAILQVLPAGGGAEIEVSGHIGVCRRYQDTGRPRGWKRGIPGGYEVVSDFDRTNWITDHYLQFNGYWGFYPLCTGCDPGRQVPPSL